MRLMRQFTWLSVLVVTAVLTLYADTWSAPAAELATRIVAKTGPGSAITLVVNNRSSLSPSEVRSITSQLESQLRSQRMEIVAPSQAVANVNVTLSENVQGYLWVTQIQQGSESDLVMQSVARQQSTDMGDGSALTLRRRLLLAQDEPILDVDLMADSAVVLSPSHVTWYRVQGTNWQEMQSRPLTYSRAMPRDVRGRLWSNSTAALGVSLPGVRCTQTTAGGASLNCAETDDPWPVNSGASIATEAFFSPVRNFFNGTIAFYDPQKQAAGPASYTVPPFYSMASIVEDGLPLWLFTGVDGRLTLFGGKTGTIPRTSSIQGWGSDIASIASSCKPDEQFVIASRNGDQTKPDALQTFQIVNREAVPAAEAVEFAGPITALWTSAADNAAAVAVSRNLTTGKYEAYSLSLVCSQ
jgi:hypothetical protein